MKLQGAVIREQGITFAIVIVKRHILDNRHEAGRTQMGFQPVFPGLPIVLMAQDHNGRANYLGRPDIVRFLARVPMSAIPWREYTVN